MLGTVLAYDEHKGYGEVECADGQRLFFHCTAIADGTRCIPSGARVVFQVVAGHRGRFEATNLVPL